MRDTSLTVLGIDPGIGTGWSLNRNNTEIAHGVVLFQNMTRFLIHELKAENLDAVVIEDFALLGSKALAQIGSKFETCQVIGMFKLWAAGKGYPVILQPPSIKPIAQKFSGRKPKGPHSLSHDIDAYNHSIYYLKKKGCYETVLEKELREHTYED